MSYISDLDAALLDAGQTATLRRVSGTAPSVTNKDVSVRVVVRSPNSAELSSGITQADYTVIMSPTEIADAGWPVGESASLTVPDPTLPRPGDRLIVGGRYLTVVDVNDFTVNDERVRIELRARG